MKILMLCPMLSSSSMITVYPMAKALSKKHHVKLMGPLMGGKPFMDYDGLGLDIVEPPVPKPPQAAMLSLYPRNVLKLMHEDYDVVHAFKLLPHTAPAASMAKQLRKKKFVLSIDDYDVAASKNIAKRLAMKWAERSCRNADGLTVSSAYLQRLYGGEVVYQVPNESLFLKKRCSGAGARKRLGLQGKKLILYAGTFYEHKGLDVLISAVQKLARSDLRLVLAGGGGVEGALRKMAGQETVFAGRLPMEQMPELTAAADIYAIPTKDTEYARAEIPGKIFEPMMLGKPIIASRISDIPRILDNGRCGLLPRPGDADALAQAIQFLVDNPKEARRLGAEAKKRYFRNYSMEHYSEKVNKVYRGLGL